MWFSFITSLCKMIDVKSSDVTLEAFVLLTLSYQVAIIFKNWLLILMRCERLHACTRP